MSRAARIEVKNLRAAISENKGVVDGVTASTYEISDAISEMSGSEMDASDIPHPSDVEPQARYVYPLVSSRAVVESREFDHFISNCVSRDGWGLSSIAALPSQ